MTTAVLNVKINETLKEKLRHYAQDHDLNLSVATERLIEFAFAAEEAGVTGDDVDSQHTEEDISPFTPKEIKALRKLLKKKK